MSDLAETAVRITEVTKTFGKLKAVDDLSLTVPKGCIYGFIGPNGSGKTTTLRMILNIVHPDHGTIEVLGQRTHRAANDRIGYLPEERGLYKKMSVKRVLIYFAQLKGMSRGVPEAVDHWLEKMGLAQFRHRKIEQLSKGMAQKIQFIAAVLSQPELLILDEPFSGLDPLNLEVLQAAILELRSKGTTVIFSTHDINMAEKMCDFVLMIFRGKKVLDGTLESIQKNYGEGTIRLRILDAPGVLGDIPGINSLRDAGHYQEFQYAGDPQELLTTLSRKGRINLFEVKRPSLHEIFVRIAGAEDPSDHV